jgi:iron complex outermembrane receptor protein
MHDMTLDLKLYRERIDPVINHVDDKRDINLDPYQIASWVQIQNNNIGSIDVDGFEARLVYRPRPATFLALTYAYASSEGYFLDEYDKTVAGLCPGPPDAAGYIPICLPFSERTPTHSYSLLGGYRFATGWEAGMGVYGASNFTWFGDGDRLPSYTRVDARLAKKFKIGNSNADIALIGQNLGGDYLEFRDDNVFDTRAYVQFSLSFP